MTKSGALTIQAQNVQGSERARGHLECLGDGLGALISNLARCPMQTTTNMSKTIGKQI